MFIDIFYALLFIGMGMALIKYRRSVKSWTGSFVWAERYIGNGGTYIVMILLGLFLIFLGVTYPFGGLNLIFGEKPTPEEILNR